MSPDANAKAYEALQRAIALKEKANERERAYIDALSKRYAAEPPEDRKAQGQKAEADRARRRFERAWARADIELTRTRF